MITEVQYETIRTSFESKWRSVIADLLVGGTLIYTFWNITNTSPLILWFGLLSTLALLRLLYAHLFSKDSKGKSRLSYWQRILVIDSLLAGLLWGSIGYLAFPVNSFYYKIILVALLGGMVTGSLPLFSYYFRTFFIFSSLTLLPLAYRFWTGIGTEFNTHLTFLILIYLLFMLLAARRFYTNYRDSLNNKYKNIELLKELSSAKKQLEKEVSHQQQKEKKLSESEQRFKTLSLASFEGIFIHDHGVIMDMNPTFNEMFGYNHSELLGRSFTELITDDYQAAIRRQIEEKPLNFIDLEGLRKDGSFFPLVLRGRDFEYEGRMVRVAAIRDMSERKESEKKLRESENEIASILNNMQDTFFRFDKSRKLIMVSHSCEGLLGYKPKEIIGTNTSQLFTDAKDQELITEQLSISGGKVTDFETRMLHKSGNEVWVSLNIQYLLNSDDEPIGTEGTIRNIDRQKQLEQLLRESSERYRSLFEENFNLLENSPAGILKLDREMRIVYMNSAIKQILGLEPGREAPTIGSNILEIKSVREAGLEQAIIAIKNGENLNIETPFTSIYGRESFLAIRGVALNDEDGFAGVMLLVNDISEDRKSKRRLFEEKERAQVTLEAIREAVITTDINGLLEYANPLAQQYLGASLEELSGKPLTDYIRLSNEETGQPLPNPVIQCLEKKIAYRSHEPMLLHHNVNTSSSVEITAAPIQNRDGVTIGAVMVIHDLTELRILSRRLAYQATHDPLTGLSNRREFESCIEKAIESAQNEKLNHTICFVDLDQFKVINDTCGHFAGDELLKKLAPALNANISENDIIARIGGDEFGILLRDTNLSEALSKTETLRNTIKNFRFIWNDKIFNIGASFGLAPIESSTINMYDTLSMADAACYIAKERGRNNIHVFEKDDSSFAILKGQMQWFNIINDALENENFELFYQPIVPLGSKKNDPDASTVRCEFLLRMNRDNGPLISPSEFIPAAERYHLMPNIDRWVITRVLSRLAENHEEVKSERPIFTVNISGQSLDDPTFLSFISDALKKYSIPPNCICFEITETAVISTLTVALHFIESLRSLGCLFALDDFGSGISSLSNLKRLPVDYIKINGDFIKDILNNHTDYIMVRSIINIGHSMNLQTIAEASDNSTIMDKLEEMGVDYAQGFSIGKPQKVDDAFASNVIVRTSRL